MEHDTEPTDAELTEAELTEAKLTETGQASSESESAAEGVLPSSSEDGSAPAPEAAGDSSAPAPEAAGDSSAPAPEATEDGVAPAAEATGDSRVDAAIAHLGNLAELPVSDHPPVFERIHGELVEVLGELHTGVSLADHPGPGESDEG
jgi:hypothetical protein